MAGMSDGRRARVQAVAALDGLRVAKANPALEFGYECGIAHLRTVAFGRRLIALPFPASQVALTGAPVE
jgi:hypothetical protein